MKNQLKTFVIISLIIFAYSCSKENSDTTKLAVGESKTVTISAELKWNQTAIEVESGESYLIVSEGTWTDLTTETDANGYTDPNLDAFSSFKRDTSANWFELIVSSNETDLYKVGANKTIKFNEAGKLSFFANDAEDFYENNSGSISTTITRQ